MSRPKLWPSLRQLAPVEQAQGRKTPNFLLEVSLRQLSTVLQNQVGKELAALYNIYNTKLSVRQTKQCSIDTVELQQFSPFPSFAIFLI